MPLHVRRQAGDANANRDRLAAYGLKRRCPLLAVIVVLLTLTGCHFSFGDLDPAETPAPTFSEDALNFIVLGDWGRNGRFSQDDVAREMGETAAEIDAAFVISTGDNFYDRGVRSVTDPKWVQSYESVYTTPSLQIPWYITIGNHDYLGDVSAQVAYTDISDRWELPSRYHAADILVDDTTEALFVFLDTVPLVDGRSASTPEAEVADRKPSAEWDPEQQLAWLDSTLANSEAEWRFVAGHHALYAADGRHRDYPILRETVGPILDRHGVDVYFAGHVHALQHLEPEGTKVHHVVSGGGSLASKIARDVEVTFAAGVPGFAAMSLTPDTLHLVFIGHKGTVGYSAAITPRDDGRSGGNPAG